MLIGGGIAVYVLTAGDDKSNTADETTTGTQSTATESTSLPPTESTPTADTPTESTADTPTESSNGRPTFSGDQPSEDIYLGLASQLVQLGKSGDSSGGRALLVKELESTLTDQELCAGETSNLFAKVDTGDFDFKNFATAGAYVDFINNGVTVNIGMSFQDDEVVIDTLFVYATN
ncbi:MAG: hypothetical protein ACR2FP_11755 [Nocardioidaceae bacterium]